MRRLNYALCLLLRTFLDLHSSLQHSLLKSLLAETIPIADNQFEIQVSKAYFNLSSPHLQPTDELNQTFDSKPALIVASSPSQPS
mmetsp:Transcript_233/g.279  ORF Transcript_233/g.279 Transcript_233/m.279 type:complete len:85 (-) Transcript_233:227-481(-)